MSIRARPNAKDIRTGKRAWRESRPRGRCRRAGRAGEGISPAPRVSRNPSARSRDASAATGWTSASSPRATRRRSRWQPPRLPLEPEAQLTEWSARRLGRRMRREPELDHQPACGVLGLGHFGKAHRSATLRTMFQISVKKPRVPSFQGFLNSKNSAPSERRLRRSSAMGRRVMQRARRSSCLRSRPCTLLAVQTGFPRYAPPIPRPALRRDNRRESPYSPTSPVQRTTDRASRGTVTVTSVAPAATLML